MLCCQDASGRLDDHLVPVRRPQLGEVWRLMVLWLSTLVATALLFASPALAQDEFLDPEDAFQISVAQQGEDTLGVHFEIAPGYYMYRKRFGFDTEPASDVLGAPVFPQGVVTYDPTFEEDMEVYRQQVTILLPLNGTASGQPLDLSITSQGCADQGLCYPPQTHSVQLTPGEGGYVVAGKGVVASVPPPQDQDSAASSGPPASKALTSSDGSASGMGQALQLGDMGLAAYLQSAGWLQIMLIALVLGVLLTFTPCVLPMVPIAMAVIVGDARQRQQSSRLRGLGLAATYVLGMSIVYTALGVAAGLIGASMAAWLQTPWVLAVFAILLATLALAMFDVFSFQAPVGVQSRLSQWMSAIPGGRWGGAFLMGMISALIVGPCVAAPLAGVLLFISQTGDVVIGGSALFALAWGQGALLLLMGATSGALLPKAGPWMEGVKHFFGVLLLATAWWLLSPVLPAWVLMLGWAVLAGMAAVMLGAFEPVRANGGEQRAGVGRYVSKSLGLLLSLWAALLLAGLAAGGRDVLRPLAPFVAPTATMASADPSSPTASPAFTQVRSVQELDHVLANASGPVMLDFYADWCVSCIEMERFTFTDPAVQERMQRLVLVQADVTKNTDDDRALLKRFSLFGPPGIIFFNNQGQPLDDMRVVGFKKASDFALILDRVLSTTSS